MRDLPRRTLSSAASLGRGLVDLLLPARCAVCGAALDDTDSARPTHCPRCRGTLPWLPVGGCPLCQRAAGGARMAPAAGERCGGCEGFAPLEVCIAAVSYAGDAESWIRRFKSPGRGLLADGAVADGVARWLAREAAARVPAAPPDRVVPVPLHPRRLRERGFNPAALLAREVSRVCGAPFSTGALHRLRDTPSQRGLRRRERERNVTGAFRCRGRVPPRIWIVDDVVTTGSTLAETARALRRAGADRIAAVCAARTPLPD